jgi:hypothetical protein
MDALGKVLVMLGLAIAVAGAIVWLVGSRTGGGFLPGDLSVQRGNVRFYFPIVTCLGLSLLLSWLTWLLRR